MDKASGFVFKHVGYDIHFYTLAVFARQALNYTKPTHV